MVLLHVTAAVLVLGVKLDSDMFVVLFGFGWFCEIDGVVLVRFGFVVVAGGVDVDVDDDVEAANERFIDVSVCDSFILFSVVAVVVVAAVVVVVSFTSVVVALF